MESSKMMSRGPLPNKIYIGGIDAETTTIQLEDFFRDIGKIKSVWIARNPPGFGFVEFESVEDAERAVSEKDGKEFLGRPIRVEISSKPMGKSSRGGRGGGEGRGGGSRGSGPSGYAGAPPASDHYYAPPPAAAPYGGYSAMPYPSYPPADRYSGYDRPPYGRTPPTDRYGGSYDRYPRPPSDRYSSYDRPSYDRMPVASSYGQSSYPPSTSHHSGGREPPICYSCRQVGHMARDCPEARGLSNRRSRSRERYPERAADAPYYPNRTSGRRSRSPSPRHFSGAAGTSPTRSSYYDANYPSAPRPNGDATFPPGNTEIEEGQYPPSPPRADPASHNY